VKNNISEKMLNSWRKEIRDKFGSANPIKFPEREKLPIYDINYDIAYNFDFEEWELEMAVFRWGR